jgi:phosphomannomutase
MNKTIPEVLNLVAEAKSLKEAADILVRNRTGALEICLRANYDPSIEAIYTQNTIPQYDPDDSPIGYSYSSLFREADRLPYFFKTNKLIENENRRNQKLKIILESINSAESLLLEKILTKSYVNPNINIDVINAAFPNLIDERMNNLL